MVKFLRQCNGNIFSWGTIAFGGFAAPTPMYVFFTSLPLSSMVFQWFSQIQDRRSAIRARRVGVFDFGTGRVGYLPKSSGIGTGWDG